MNKFMVFALLILLQISGYGQITTSDTAFQPRLCGILYVPGPKTEGSPFYNDEWINSDILLSNREMVTNKPLKYNAFIDEVIWFCQEKSVQVQLEKHFIDRFYLKQFQGKTVCFKRIHVPASLTGDTLEIFAEALYEGRMSLYAKRQVVVGGTVTQTKEAASYIYDKLVVKPRYYLVLPNHEVVMLRQISRRTVLKALPLSYRNIAKEILGAHHLQLHTENDLVDLLTQM